MTKAEEKKYVAALASFGIVKKPDGQRVSEAILQVKIALAELSGAACSCPPKPELCNILIAHMLKHPVFNYCDGVACWHVIDKLTAELPPALPDEAAEPRGEEGEGSEE